MSTGQYRIGFIISISFLILLSVISFSSINRLIHNLEMIAHSHSTLMKLENIISLTKDAEISQRGYLITRDSSYLELMKDANEKALSNYNQAYLMIREKDQHYRLDTLKALMDKRFEQLNYVIYMQQYGREITLGTGMRYMDGMKKIISELKDYNQKQLIEYNQQANIYMILTPVVSFMLSLFAGLIAAFSFINLLKDYQKIKHAEEETRTNQNTLEKVMNSSESGIIVYQTIRDEQHNINDFMCILMNTASEKYTGYKKEDLRGKLMSEMFPENWTSGLFQKFVRVVETNQSANFEFYLDLIDKWYQFMIVKLDDGCAVNYTDITERIQYQTELKKYQNELEHKIQQLKSSNIELERFAYVASHDLQEPLRKITSFGGRLVQKYKDQLDETGIDYLDRMQSASFRMQKMITDLLNFSRISRNTEPFTKIGLSTILDDVVNSLEYTIKKKKAKIKYESLPEIEVIPSQITQLFQNLISNSLKFSKENTTCEIDITSELFTVKEKHRIEYCRIYFKDNGIGFDQKYAERIFVIFQRLHGVGDYEGTGIGLAICRKVIDHHNGVITVKSIEGEGTTFIITLPVKQPL
jgi:signal transduction histidine kinase